MKKILIVDDDSDLLQMLQLILKNKGCKVVTSTNCSGGLVIFHSFRPDLVILDVNVGDEDGREMCRSIKSDAQFLDVPVLLISANADALKDYQLHGATAKLNKPFEITELVSFLNQYA